MSSNFFSFKRFDVHHEGAAMKVGTDGVLLGLLAPVKGARVLDIGTGSGLVALILAQRYEADAHIVGIDIDEGAACQARRNFESSPWADRLHAECQDICTYQNSKPFDLIVSNPPYYEHSLQSQTLQRTVSRSGVSLTLEDLAHKSSQLLDNEGLFCVVLPMDVSEKFRMTCWLEGLHLINKVEILTREGKVPKRTVMTFSHRSAPLEVSRLVLMDKDGNRTKAYSDLVADFFVK